MPIFKTSIIDVAIVGDHAALGAGLCKIVESADDLCCLGIWTGLEKAFEKSNAFRPQVVLMDINLPGMSGVEATARIKRHQSQIEVIMVTVHSDHEQIFAALKAGASGYLLKRSTPEEVRQAIRDVRSGGAPMSAEIARRVVDAFYQPIESPETKAVEFSKRETEILELLAKGLGNKEIANRLDIGLEAVRFNLRRVYEKFRVHSRTAAALKFRDFKKDSRLPVLPHRSQTGICLS